MFPVSNKEQLVLAEVRTQDTSACKQDLNGKTVVSQSRKGWNDGEQAANQELMCSSRGTEEFVVAGDSGEPRRVHVLGPKRNVMQVNGTAAVS